MPKEIEDIDEDLDGSSVGDIPWKVGPNAHERRRYPDGNQSSGKSHNDHRTDRPTESDRTVGNTNSTQLSAMRKDAFHLKVDHNLRGSINYITETEGLDWKQIDSIEYMDVPKISINLEKFPRSQREDGIIVFHANNPNLKEAGLQHVKGNEFPDNAVMVFYKTANSSFHMTNVDFPLDILFTDERGEVLAIKEMVPGTKLTHSPAKAVHAIEAKHGWADKNNIKVGSRLYGLINDTDPDIMNLFDKKK